MVPETLERYDSLYVSPHSQDAVFACAARLGSEARRDLRILLLVLFGEERGERPPSLRADWTFAGLPEAPRRHAVLRSFGAALDPEIREEEDWLDRVARLVDAVGRRVRAAHVYLPLGVGGHADHRLAHEAGLRAFPAAAGRDVFLYEERPQVFVRGALRLRLGQIAARLPPAAAHVPERVGLARFLLRFHTAQYVGAHLRGPMERVGVTRATAREWRKARAWDPLKAFGPRLQPVLHAPDDDTWREARDWVSRQASECSSGEALERLGAEYARRLGEEGHRERLWLLLPPREDGVLSSDEALAALGA